MSDTPDHTPTNYVLVPYITPYLKDLEKILFEHRGHTIITILRDHDFEATCATCSKRVFLRPILVHRAIIHEPDPV